MEFSAGVWNMAKLSIHPRAQAVRLTMDKQVQGRLYSKFAKTDEGRVTFGLCPLCKQPDSQHHYILDCNYPHAKRIRQETILEATDMMTTIRQEQQDKQDREFALKPTSKHQPIAPMQ